MHRVKGLEFNYMFLVGVNKNYLPLKSAIKSTDPVTKAEAITGERCLLYVALTRAKKEASISGYGQLSEFVAQ
ncbi:MAG: 3'-5' exonuclease [Clostridia bacterium]|nr:3'-5' exonuclease [Clostridia bacterium]